MSARTTRPNEERELLAGLARAVGLADPVPAEALEAARASLTWLRVDAELAELLADSKNAPRASGEEANTGRSPTPAPPSGSSTPLRRSAG